jgi:clan AA aspartic protease
MPEYSADFFNPPAPLAFVTLKNPQNEIEIVNVPMLIDTGADATLIPKMFVEKLNLDSSDPRIFEIEAFDKTVSQSAVVRLQMVFEGRSFRGEYLITEQDYGIIGRNVLNSLKIVFDGQNLRWEIL